MKILYAICLWGFIPMLWSQVYYDPALGEVREYLRTQEYILAENWVLTNLEKLPAIVQDEALYLQALAQFHGQKLSACKETLQKLIGKSDGTWYYKARYLLAQVLLKEKNFEALESIYAAEAKRLLADNRKEETIRLYLDFAELFSKKDNGDSENLPNYARAKRFVQFAIDICSDPQMLEDLLYREAELSTLAQDAAIESWNRYLIRYDLEYAQDYNKAKEFIHPGRQCMMARYSLAEAYFQADDTEACRNILVKLIVHLNSQKNEIREKARWLLIQSYTIQHSNFLHILQSINQYLAEFPDGPNAIRAAYRIVEIYQKLSMIDESIVAIENFLEKRSFVLNDSNTLAGQEKPSKLYEKLRQDAIFNLGKLYAHKHDCTKAIQLWESYLTNFPNGDRWTKAQHALLDAEYQIGEDLLAEGKYDECQKVWLEFISKHPLSEYNSKIIYALGMTQYAKAEENKPKEDTTVGNKAKYEEHLGQTVALWQKFASQLKETEKGIKALYALTKIYDEELGESEKALEIYQTLLQDSSMVEHMKKKYIAIQAKPKYATSKAPIVECTFRNIPKVTFKLYRLQMEDYFRKYYSKENIDNLDLALIQPDRSWEMTISNYKPIQRTVQNVTIDLPNVGAYVLRVDDESDREATTLLLWSDMQTNTQENGSSIIVKTSVPSTKVLLSDGAKIVAEGISSDDGIFCHDFMQETSISTLHIFADKDGHVDVSSIQDVRLQFKAIDTNIQAYVVSDRVCYTNQETVHVYAILRTKNDSQQYIIPNDTAYLLKILTPYKVVVCQQKLHLSDFGSLSYSWKLPAFAPKGIYTIEILPEDKNGKPLDIKPFCTSFFMLDWKEEANSIVSTPYVELNMPKNPIYHNRPVTIGIKTAHLPSDSKAHIILYEEFENRDLPHLDWSRVLSVDNGLHKIWETCLCLRDNPDPTIEFSFPKVGQYRAIASIEDSTGTLQCQAYQSNINVIHPASLLIVPSISHFSVGEVANIEIFSTGLEGAGLWTITNNNGKILESKMIPIQHGKNIQPVSIITNFYPSIQISISLVESGKQYRNTQQFDIANVLQIDLQANIQENGISVAISTENFVKNSISSEVSLVLFPKKLWNIYQKFMINIPSCHTFFRKPISLVHYSSETYFPSKILPSNVFLGNILTDASSGKANVILPLPAEGGEWYLVAVGCNNAELFGEKVIEINIPTTLSQKDSTQTVSVCLGWEKVERYAGYTEGNIQKSITIHPKNVTKQVIKIQVQPFIPEKVFPHPKYLGKTFSYAALVSNLLAYTSVLEYYKARHLDYAEVQSNVQDILDIIVSQPVEETKHLRTNIINKSQLIYALLYAKSNGIFVDEKYLETLLATLDFSRLASEDTENKALVQYVMTVAGKGNFAYANRLYREHRIMKPKALGYTALLLHALDKKDMAMDVLELLLSSVLSKEKHGIGCSLENTSLALWGLSILAPQDERIARLVQDLLQQKDIHGFLPQFMEGIAIHSLTKYFLQVPQPTYTTNVEIYVNSQKIGCDSQIYEIMPTEEQINVEFRANMPGYYYYTISYCTWEMEPAQQENTWDITRQVLHRNLKYNERSLEVESTHEIDAVACNDTFRIKGEIKPIQNNLRAGYYVVEEPFPYGMEIPFHTLHTNATSVEIYPDKISYFWHFEKDSEIFWMEHELVATKEWKGQIPPIVLRDVNTNVYLDCGKILEFSVVDASTPLAPYKFNNDENYVLGKLYFADKKYDLALEHLSNLYDTEPEKKTKDVITKLLAIHTLPKYYSAQKIVNYFEILKEKYPDIYISFEQMLIVGQAYRDIQEYERAYLVFQAIVDSYFDKEAKVAGMLEDQAQFLASVDYVLQLWKNYPDSANIAQMYFGLSQALYAKLDNPEILRGTYHFNKDLVQKTPTKEEILAGVVALLQQFMAIYPQSEKSPQAAFSLASAYLAQDSFEQVIKVSQQSAKLYKASALVPSFQYMEALGYFSQYKFEQAITTAKIVAEGNSKDKNFATYILGQIYHTQGDVVSAIETYKKVSNEFHDADESIKFLSRQYITLPEITKILPKEPVRILVEHCNIHNAQFLVYNVDFVRLYMLKKDLSNITKVRLSGISPTLEKNVTLSTSTYSGPQKTTVEFEFSEAGAYLIICRGDSLFTSGLILISPLEISVQEISHTGSVRVHVKNVVDNTLSKGVQIKVIGSNDAKIISGESDLRGIFATTNVEGLVTVIARQGNCYAFYRGQTKLMTRRASTKMYKRRDLAPQRDIYQEDDDFLDEELDMKEKESSKMYELPSTSNSNNFRFNIESSNRAIQEENVRELHQQMRQSSDGVQIERAKK